MFTAISILVALLLFVICPLAAVLFIVRLVCATFSSELSNQMRKHPVIHRIWGCFAFVGVLVFFGVLNLNAWPPLFIERHEQRQEVLQRVQSAGGWKAVRLGCETLATNYPNGFIWFPSRSNVWVYPNPTAESHKHYITNLDYGLLPAAVAALHPKDIRFETPRQLGDVNDDSQTIIVSIWIFGTPGSHVHPTPYYGLAVPCGVGADNYKPQISEQGVIGNRHSSVRKVADGVFEVY